LLETEKLEMILKNIGGKDLIKTEVCFKFFCLNLRIYKNSGIKNKYKEFPVHQKTSEASFYALVGAIGKDVIIRINFEYIY